MAKIIDEFAKEAPQNLYSILTLQKWPLRGTTVLSAGKYFIINNEAMLSQLWSGAVESVFAQQQC